MKRYCCVGLILAGSALLVGCGPTAADMERAGQKLVDQANGGTAIPGSEFASIPKELIQMMKDQGVLDKFVADCRLHGLNPGLKVEKGQVIYFKIGLDGVDLDTAAKIEGTGTQLPTGVRQALIDGLKGLEGRTDPEAAILRQKIWDLLGWNRVESAHNPVP